MSALILVVDDEPSVCRLVRRVLAGQSYEFLDAADGTRGLELALSRKPDMILLDVNMPGLDGNTLTRMLRADARTAMTPVILLTGDGRPERKVLGFDAGADDYVTKPFEASELTARIAGVLRRNARALSANPLTSLPGAPAIELEVSRRLHEAEPFAFLYADIDRFKAFNDAYGYARGDGALKAFADLLKELVRSCDSARSFLGHIGGDDFVSVVPLERGEALAREIATRFDLLVPSLYSPEDRDKGVLAVGDRVRGLRRVPLMSVSIAVVTNERPGLAHYGQVVGIAAEIKRHLKSEGGRRGSAYLTDRRKQ
jgi:diguanylate cyclase (GGDEF)-like protein